MRNRYITIIKNDKGQFSVHSSYKAACEVYGFKKTQKIPETIEGHTVKKVPFDVSIDCLELVEFLTDEETIIKKLKNARGYYFHCFNYERDAFDLFTSVKETGELDEVLKCYRIDDGYQEVKLDEWTQNEVLNILTVS